MPAAHEQAPAGGVVWARCEVSWAIGLPLRVDDDLHAMLGHGEQGGEGDLGYEDVDGLHDGHSSSSIFRATVTRLSRAAGGIERNACAVCQNAARLRQSAERVCRMCNDRKLAIAIRQLLEEIPQVLVRRDAVVLASGDADGGYDLCWVEDGQVRGHVQVACRWGRCRRSTSSSVGQGRGNGRIGGAGLVAGEDALDQLARSRRRRLCVW